MKRMYFQKGENKWQGYFRVKREIRETIRFQRLNLMNRFHFKAPFDAIFCRNVMIYFDMPTKQDLVERLSQVLVQGGYLFVGHSESLTGIKHRLAYVQPSVYKRCD